MMMVRAADEGQKKKKNKNKKNKKKRRRKTEKRPQRGAHQERRLDFFFSRNASRNREAIEANKIQIFEHPRKKKEKLKKEEEKKG